MDGSGNEARHRWALLALFLSGAAGLVHEVAWAKLLARLIGSTAHAQALVLALFMGGLAIGAVRYGRRVSAGPEGLRLYGRLEIRIGAYGVALPALAQLAAGAHDALAPLTFGSPAPAFALRFVLAAAIALLPAIWMGGTLPVLAACLTSDPGQTRRRVGALYAANNLGAVLGAILAGDGVYHRSDQLVHLLLRVVRDLRLGSAGAGHHPGDFLGGALVV